MIMMAYGVPKAILMDLDDTILKGGNTSEQCWRAVCACFADKIPKGITISELCDAINEIWDLYGTSPEYSGTGKFPLSQTRQQIVSMALSSLGSHDNDFGQALADAYEKIEMEVTIPFPRVIETLEILRAKKVRLGLVTNGNSQVQRRKIQRHDLEQYFDTILIEDELGKGKPDPFVFEHALNTLDVKPSEAWMIGDDLRGDIAPAQRVGMLGIWIDIQGRGIPRFSNVKPDRILRSLPEITKNF